MNQVIEAEPGFGNGAEGVEPNDVVPLMLTETGEEANEQNELDESRRKAEGGEGGRVCH